MSAVIDIGADIAGSVRRNGLFVSWAIGRVYVSDSDGKTVAVLYCETNEEAARVVALARGWK